MPRWPHPTIGYHGGEKGAQVVVMSTGTTRVGNAMCAKES